MLEHCAADRRNAEGCGDSADYHKPARSFAKSSAPSSRSWRLQLIEGSASQQRTHLERGEVHLAITQRAVAGWRIGYCLPSMCWRFCGKRIHSLGTTSSNWRSCRSTLCCCNAEYGSRVWFDAACESLQIRPLVLMESTTAHTLTELAAVGHGIAVVPSTSTIRGLLRAIPIVHRGTSIGFGRQSAGMHGVYYLRMPIVRSGIVGPRRACVPRAQVHQARASFATTD